MADDAARITNQDVQKLVNKGNELLNILEQNYIWKSKEYAMNRSRFISGYIKWYKQSLAVVRNLSPDRSNRFQSLFSIINRSDVNEYTYTVQDYIHGAYLENGPKNYSDEVTSRKVKEQIEILRSASARINEFSFDLGKFVKINPIYSNSTQLAASDTNQILQIELGEDHYNSLKTEINSTFRLGLFISTYLLARELIESLLIDILRVIFPPTSEENITLYYDNANEKFKELEMLLDTITRKREELPFDEEALDELTSILDRMVFKEKPTSYSRIRILDRNDILDFNIGETVEILQNTKQALKK